MKVQTKMLLRSFIASRSYFPPVVRVLGLLIDPPNKLETEGEQTANLNHFHPHLALLLDG